MSNVAVEINRMFDQINLIWFDLIDESTSAKKYRTPKDRNRGMTFKDTQDH